MKDKTHQIIAILRRFQYFQRRLDWWFTQGYFRLSYLKVIFSPLVQKQAHSSPPSESYFLKRMTLSNYVQYYEGSIKCSEICYNRFDFELLIDQKVLRATKYLKCCGEFAIKPTRDLDWVSVCSPLSALEDGRQYFFRTDSIQYFYIGRVIITHIAYNQTWPPQKIKQLSHN